jgi:hypothetical protein
MVKFFIPKTNVIESDQGFSVEILGPTGLRYIEPGMILHIDSELLSGSAGLILYGQNITIESPKGGIALENIDRNRIIENIRAAFRFRGFEIQVY